MLTRLFIRNIALIKETEVTFDAGLTVVTGETGAGKSMFMDALGLCLGERADQLLIRQGAEEAQVEATFDLASGANHLQALLEEHEIMPEEGELVLRRVISRAGKSRAFANGVRLTLQQLQAVGERLADIHGQQEQQLLLKPSRHGELLDQFGGLGEPRQAVAQAWQKWRRLRTKLDEAQARVLSQEREEALLGAFLEELEEMNYNAGEEEHLAAERLRLMSSEQTIDALRQAHQSLSGDQLFLKRMSQAQRALEEVAEKAGQDVTHLAERLGQLVLEINEATRDMEGLATTLQPDPDLLAQVDNRLAALRDLARKHRVEVKDLPDVYEKLQSDLEDLSLLQDSLEDLEKRERQAWETYEKQAKILSKGRQSAAPALMKALEQSLAGLKMEKTRFHVLLEELSSDQWAVHGMERVSFQVAVNPGSPPQPLEKVASGGEVSRLMLALKSVFFAKMPALTLVFDEIDTGIGGAVADAAGDALATLATVHQVVAITHQPQVAAKGKNHLKIEKLTDGKTTRTVVTRLDQTKRQEELARMLSGKQVTEEARKAADSLLKGAA